VTTAHSTTDGKIDAAKAVLDTAAADVAGLDGAAMRGTDDAYTGTPPTAEEIDTQLSASHDEGSWAAGEFSQEQIEAIAEAVSEAVNIAGTGAIEWPYTLTDSGTGLPIADVSVWVSTDAAGENVIASGSTDAYGVVTFYLDAGTVYVWRQKAGYSFSNPDTEVVS
jgi:hypothetical protein